MGSFPGVLPTFYRCYESVMIVVLSCALEDGGQFCLVLHLHCIVKSML